MKPLPSIADSIALFAKQEEERIKTLGLAFDTTRFVKEYFDVDLFEHQKFWDEKANKEDQLLINCSVDCGKSYFFGLFYPLMKICQNRDISILFAASGFESIAKPTGKTLGNTLRYNEHLIDDFGDFYSRKNTWSDSKFTVIREDPTKRDYTFMAIGMGMAIEGIKPNIAICDDIIDGQATYSPIYRRAAWRWYQSTLEQRVVKGGKKIFVGSIWHGDDIYSRLKGIGYKQVWQPAISEDGTILCPQLWGKLSDDSPEWTMEEAQKHLDKKKHNLFDQDGGDMFGLRYMVNPKELTGTALDPSWLRYYTDDSIRNIKFKRIVQGVDPSSGTGKDFYSRATMGLTDTDFLYLLDISRKKLDFPTRIEDIVEGIVDWTPDKVIIESNMDKGSMYDAVKLGHPEYRSLLRSFNENRNKMKKLGTLSGLGRFFKAGKIFIRKDMHRFIYEYSNFPGSHDDQLDAVALCVEELLGSVVRSSGIRAGTARGRHVPMDWADEMRRRMSRGNTKKPRVRRIRGMKRRRI